MPDKANVVVLPPVIFVVALLLGLLMEYAVPMQVLPRTPARWLGILLILGSLPIAVSAIRELFKANTALDVRKPTTVIVQTGAFRFSRNPIYIGLILFYLGIALLIDSFWVCLLVVPAVAILQIGVIRREEYYLEQKFGEDYRRYRAVVRRWI
jgi:protein-S-isoprenylcysteine O-methyltransferase Ste14